MATDQIPLPGHVESENSLTAIMRIVERASFDATFDPAKLAVLLDVQLKYEANEARKQFEQAFQLFKRNAPQILKTKKVSFATSSGDRTEYSHAELDKIAPIIQEALLAVGISQTWKTGDADGRLTVTCILKGFGHTEEAATLSGPPDTSGKKNSVQAIGSTTYYLERYTLLAATGLAAKGQDDDGKTEGMSEQGIQDYCVKMRDAANLGDLKATFNECYQTSKQIKDMNAQGQFIKVFEGRKRELVKA